MKRFFKAGRDRAGPPPVSGPHVIDSRVLLCFIAFALLGVIAYLPQLLELLKGLMQPGLSRPVSDKDFANYWMAGQLVLSGEHESLFRQAEYFPRLQEAFGTDYQIRNWSYPPHLLLLLWPLGLLSYKAALVAFLAVTCTLFLGSLFAFRRALEPGSRRDVLLTAVTVYAAMMVVTTQNGFLTASFLLFGLALMKRRPVLAGLSFALLTIKPQLGVLVPLLLLFDRNWTAILWAAIGTLVLVLLSAFFFGFESWHAYLTETLAYQRFVMTDWHGIFLRMMPTVFGGARTLGLSPETAIALQWPVCIASAGLVAWVLWKDPDPLRKAFAVTVGTFLVSPYAFNYDMGALVAVAAVLFGSSRLPSSSLSQLAVGMVAVLAPVVMNLGRAGVPVAPLILAAALAALVVETGRQQGMAAGAHS